MQLLYYPDPRLRKIARPVRHVDDKLRQTVRDMFQVMYQTRGIGLAAPQVGCNLRLIVANLTADPEQADREEVYLNPEILDRKGEIREEEACLSFPGLYAVIPRAAALSVRYTDLEERTRVIQATELHARLFEHEIDHLDGILIVDRLTPADRAKWSPLLKQMEADYLENPKNRRYEVSEAGL